MKYEVKMMVEHTYIVIVEADSRQEAEKNGSYLINNRPREYLDNCSTRERTSVSEV